MRTSIAMRSVSKTAEKFSCRSFRRVSRWTSCAFPRVISMRLNAEVLRKSTVAVAFL